MNHLLSEALDSNDSRRLPSNSNDSRRNLSHVEKGNGSLNQYKFGLIKDDVDSNE
jgi:hypothetical protein